MEGICKTPDDITIRNLYSPACRLCGLACSADREHSVGLCGAGDSIRIASYTLHHSEEPVISGSRGSGTVFFSHCSMHCTYCQNYPISQAGVGKDYSVEELGSIFLKLEQRGAHNINLVTPTHYLWHIKEALRISRSSGLQIPVVYNTSSYENPEAAALTGELADVYLADIRYSNNHDAMKYSACPDYREIVFNNIEQFIRNKPYPVINDNIMTSGVIVRVLVLPGKSGEVKEILEFLKRIGPKHMYLSLMAQYHPYYQAIGTELDRTVSEEEYEPLVDYALNAGFENLFIQDIE